MWQSVSFIGRLLSDARECSKECAPHSFMLPRLVSFACRLLENANPLPQLQGLHIGKSFSCGTKMHDTRQDVTKLASSQHAVGGSKGFTPEGQPVYGCRPHTMTYLLRLLARLPAGLPPLLALVLALRLRFFRLTGEGLADSEELAALAFTFTSSLSESLEVETAGLAGAFAFSSSLSELLAAAGLVGELSEGAGDSALTSAFLAGGLASESEEKVFLGSGLSDSSLTGVAFLADLLLGLSLSWSLLLLLLLPLSSILLRSLLTDFLRFGLLLTDFLRFGLLLADLLRLRGGVEGLRRLREGVRSCPLLSASRCLNDSGLMPRLRGDERLPLDLQNTYACVA